MKVAIVKCESYEQEKVDEAVKEALSLICFEFKKGVKVLLKPNLIAPFKPERAATTHPSILIALCKILKKKNAKIYIGDSPGWPNVKAVMDTSGMSRVAEEYGAELLNFNSSKKIELLNEQNKWLKKVTLPKIIKDVDVIINLPKLKTHTFTKYTGAVKNLYGFIVGGKKGYYHLITGTEKRFAEMLLDLHGFVKPQLTIMDAVVGMEGNGPTGGTPKQTGLILASENCTSLDIVASEIIGYDIKDVSTITEAKKRGFDMNVEKVGLLDVKMFYKKPFMIHQKILPAFITSLVYKNKIIINKQKCKRCLACFKKCPAKAIRLKKGVLEIDKKKCIKCYCCHELCPVHAVEVKASLFGVYGRKLLGLLIRFSRIRKKVSSLF